MKILTCCSTIILESGTGIEKVEFIYLGKIVFVDMHKFPAISRNMI